MHWVKSFGLLLVVALIVLLAIATRDPERDPRGQRREAGETAAKQDQARQLKPKPKPKPAVRREGTVTADGKPVKGVRILVHDTDEPPLWSPELLTDGDYDATTDEEGRFVVGLPQREHVYSYIAYVEGFAPSFSEVSPEEPLELELSKSEPTTITVVTEEGDPIPGAQLLVSATDFARPHLRVLTNAGGKADVLLNQDGSIHVSAPNRTRERIDGYDEERTAVLWPAFELAGRVVDTSGEPVANALVQLTEGEYDVVRSTYYPRMVTGADGAFGFRHISTGVCQIDVRADGYLGGSEFTMSGDAHVEVTLKRPASASGVVVDPEGQPVAKALLSARLGDRFFVGDTAKTDSEGRFRLGKLPPGTFTLEANFDGDELGFAPITVEEGQGLKGIRIQLEAPPESTLHLRVLLPDGRPAAEYAVSVGDDLCVADAAGEIHRKVPRPEGTDITCQVRDQRSVPNHEFSARSGPDLVEVRLPGWLTAEIHVSPADADVMVFRDPEEVRAANGVFVYRVNPELLYPLHVSAKGYATRELEWKPTKEPMVVELRKLGTVKGKLLGKGWVRANNERKDVEGEFELEGVNPGQVTVGAGRHPAMPEVIRRATLDPGGVLELGEIELPGYRFLKTTVVDGAGQPLGGAFIHIAEDGDLRWYSNEATTHADGSFSLRLPKAWRGQLIVRKFGYGQIVINSHHEGAIELPPGGDLELKIGRGKPFDFEIGLPKAGGGTYWDKRHCDPWDGYLVESDLAAGEVRLRLPGGERTFLIEAGKTTRG